MANVSSDESPPPNESLNKPTLCKNGQSTKYTHTFKRDANAQNIFECNSKTQEEYGKDAFIQRAQHPGLAAHCIMTISGTFGLLFLGLSREGNCEDWKGFDCERCVLERPELTKNPKRNKRSLFYAIAIR